MIVTLIPCKLLWLLTIIVIIIVNHYIYIVSFDSLKVLPQWQNNTREVDL